jgi:ankyrin repeat protein
VSKASILEGISKGRTDRVFDLLRLDDWRSVLQEGPVKALQWFVYYNDVTALKAVLETGGDLSSLNLDEELGHAAFFGHWKIVDFLIKHGADVNSSVGGTGERPLHSALAKAGRPYCLYVVLLLVFGPHRVGEHAREGITSDHGAGWGNGMERKFLGDYLPESLERS